MTATLSDDSVLVTHFGAKLEEPYFPIVPTLSESMGERMILMPQELNPDDLSSGEIFDILKNLASEVNVVVIVPSEEEARKWKGYADEILIGNEVAPGVAKLREGHVGLTVLVNRYDGIDLPGDACRVLALVHLPEVTSYADIVDSEVLSGSAVNLKRQIERIEQGMGRGVRSNDDYCAVLLFGAKLVSRIRSPEGQAILTPATRAQLKLSQKMAKKLGKPSTKEIKEVIKQCLDRDSGWVTVSKKALVGLPFNDKPCLDTGKIAIRAAFDFARGKRHDDAVACLDKAINATREEQVKALLLVRKATFQHAVDADGAQKTLQAAHAMEPGVTKPMFGFSYKNSPQRRVNKLQT